MHTPFITPFWNISGFFHVDYIGVFHLNTDKTKVRYNRKDGWRWGEKIAMMMRRMGEFLHEHILRWFL